MRPVSIDSCYNKLALPCLNSALIPSQLNSMQRSALRVFILFCFSCNCPFGLALCLLYYISKEAGKSIRLR